MSKKKSVDHKQLCEETASDLQVTVKQVDNTINTYQSKVVKNIKDGIKEGYDEVEVLTPLVGVNARRETGEIEIDGRKIKDSISLNLGYPLSAFKEINDHLEIKEKEDDESIQDVKKAAS